MNWELFIAWRYLRAKRKEKFISFISLISILGIALGVTALIVVIAVMNGFDRELRRKIVGINPHIYIEKHNGINNPQEVLSTLGKTEYVAASSPFINGQALFKSNEQVTGVLLRGIEPSSETKVTEVGQYLVAGGLDLGDEDIIVGSELAKKFYLGLGDKISIVSPNKGNTFDFNVAGIFNSGMYEYDLNLVVTNISAAQKIFGLQGVVGGIGVRLDDSYRAGAVRRHLQRALGYEYSVRDWMSMNKNLFSALKLEKIMQFVIVALIVVVACFSIVGTLIMIVMEKTRDIGILKAVGATNKGIKKIFTLQGLILGASGTALGAAGGVLLCWLLKTYKFISLPKDIYYIGTEGLPVQMRWMDSLLIIACALVISFLAAIYPAHQAGRLNPADALRYE
jgi:lipoprotein-releasing system permease protein